MRRRLLPAFALVLCAASASAEDLTTRVNRAIDDGVVWLKKRQGEDGSWGGIGGEVYGGGTIKPYDYPAGPTALALLTLLKCGVKPTDPVVVKGFEWLRAKHRSPGTPYEIATLILAVEARANPYKRDRKRAVDLKRAGVKSKRVKLGDADHAWMAELTKKLLAAERRGGWRYSPGVRNPQGIPRDMSNTQLAIMALHVAHRAGMKVPWHTIRDVIRWTVDQQEKTGPRHIMPDASFDRTASGPPLRARGWAYANKSKTKHETVATGTMTTGGIVVLLLGADLLRTLAPKELAVEQTHVNLAVRDGLAWLDMHWTVTHNPPRGHGSYHLMYLYGLERVGDISRKSLLGGRNWYREGATWLVDHQRRDGAWLVKDTHPPQDVLNTCFALLFLDRASLSVVTRRE